MRGKSKKHPITILDWVDVTSLKIHMLKASSFQPYFPLFCQVTLVHLWVPK